jgi:gamma-glutamyltranspeptidase/glutathione hydrolase
VLEHHRVRALECGSHRGYAIVSMPLPSSGRIARLKTLNILEGLRLRDMQQGLVASLHLLIEVMKRARAGTITFRNLPAARQIRKPQGARRPIVACE